MRLVLLCSLALLSALTGYSQVAPFEPPANTLRMRLFDEGWRFLKTDDERATAVDYDDRDWRTVHLPHDWSIEDLPEGTGLIGPFSKGSPGGISTGFTVGGTGVYRKTFTLPEDDEGKQVSVYFDGVYMESDVWINGHHLGFHPNGYTAFHYDLTDYLRFGDRENIVVVRAKNEGENSRWYTGSGIYRHVWLRVTEPINIPIWGVFVTTPVVSPEHAQVVSEVSIRNQSASDVQLTLRSKVIDDQGGIQGEAIKALALMAGESLTTAQQLTVNEPKRWSPETPSLYTMETVIEMDGKVVDVDRTVFGIRSLHFTVDKGFLLNDQPLILRGACLHHDNGILGAAAFDRAEQRKLEILKRNGFNAVRSSHNVPSQQFLDACDRLGLLVIDEAFDMWEVPKKPDDYHRFFKDHAIKDIQSMVLRDRNHPSVIIWSYGNEIFERADSSGISIAKRLIEAIKSVDDTRAVTQAICDFWEQGHADDRPWDDTAPAFALMDVHSYNYGWQRYEGDHEQFPERIIIGTESFAKEVFQNDSVTKTLPYVIGDFVWTGMDYLGEAGIGQAVLDSIQMEFPWYNGYCGDIDLIGNKKPQSFYRDVVWGRSMLEMAVEQPAPKGQQWVISKWGWRNERQSWNWKGHEDRPLDVYVYSPADSIDLVLNGKHLVGQAKAPHNRHVFHFEVPYRPGSLQAVAYRHGNEIAQQSLVTTAEPAKVILRADRDTICADPNDLAFIEVNLVDGQGRLVTDDDRIVHFEVEGEAELIAVGNANPTEMKSFQSVSCTTFRGRCMLVLRPNGTVGKGSVKAYAQGLKDAYAVIEIH